MVDPPPIPGPVAADAAGVVAAGAVVADVGALGLLVPLAAVGVLAGVFWLAWNFEHPTEPPQPPPPGRNSWWIEIEYETCTDFFPGLGFCIAWGGKETTQQSLPFVGTRNTIAYNLGKVDDIRYKIGFRDYDPVTGTYGPERQEYTYAAISDFGTKRSIKSQIYYIPITEDGSILDPIYPPLIQDPLTGDPFWLPKPNGDIKPYDFPNPLPAIPILIPGDPVPMTPLRPNPNPDPGPAPPPTPTPKPPAGPGPPPAQPPPGGPGIDKPLLPPPGPIINPPDPQKPPQPPDPQKPPKPYEPPITVPQPVDLGPLIDLVGHLITLEYETIKQTEAETLVLGDLKITSQRTRVDIGSILIELGKLEAKMEKTLERQAPKSLLDELANELLDKLSEIADSINNGNGNGDGGPCELPKMGPFARTVLAPADKTASGSPVSYDVSISEQKGEAYLEQMLAALFDHITILKGWRNYMAPKPNQGQPVTVIWEEIVEE